MKPWVFVVPIFFIAASAIAVETTIKGRRMDILEKGEAVVFTGDVRLVRGDDILTANEMRTTRTRDSVTATGNVRLYRRMSSTESLTAYGQRAFYETSTGGGYLVGNHKQARVVHAAVLSSTMTREMEIRADRIDFYREGQRALAKGKVTGETLDPQTRNYYEFASPEAEYRGDAREIVLRADNVTSPGNKPIVVQLTAEERRTLTGDSITYHLEGERLESVGGSKAVIRRKAEKKK